MYSSSVLMRHGACRSGTHTPWVSDGHGAHSCGIQTLHMKFDNKKEEGTFQKRLFNGIF